MKVFWFFFSKKNFPLLLCISYLGSRPYLPTLPYRLALSAFIGVHRRFDTSRLLSPP
jgi:hypothetical protein